MKDAGGATDAALGYAAQLETLRTTVKWLVAGLAAVGAVMVGGLQLASIGHLPGTSWRLYVSLLSAVTGLVAVGYMIKEASSVLSHEWLTLASFSDDATASVMRTIRTPAAKRQRQAIDHVVEKIDQSRHELYGYAAPTLAQLHKRLRLAEESEDTSTTLAPTVEARAEATLLRKAARDVVEYANYCSTMRSFRRMRTRVAWAAALIAVSTATFAYAANPAPADQTVHIHVEFSQ